MKWLRWMLAAVVVAASSAAAWRLVIPRYACNRQKAIINVAVISARNKAEDALTIDARGLAATCRRCLESFPEDYEFHALLAAMQEVLGDFDGAELSYGRSLHLNARPETYAHLAIAQLKRGKLDEARANLYYGSLFNLSVTEAVSDPLRTELMDAVMARHRRLTKTNDLGVNAWRKRRQERRLE